MQCLECGREVRNINYRHLMSCCGMTPRDYLVRHPGAQLVDAAVRASYGLPMARNPKWRGGRSYRDCNACGQRLDRHTKGDYCHNCQSAIRSGAQNHFFGKRHTAETRVRMVEAAKGRDRQTYRAGRIPSEKLSAMRHAYWAKVPPGERAGRLAAFIRAGQLHNKRSSKTRIENMMADLLDELNVPYCRNVPLGRYNVDFLVGHSTIIECYGDYWHCHPDMFKPQDYHRSLHITAQEKWQRDALRQENLVVQGFSFHVVWERELRNSQQAVRERISASIES